MVKERDGNDVPIKNPKTTPKSVVITSLVPSFDFLITPLHLEREKYINVV